MTGNLRATPLRIAFGTPLRRLLAAALLALLAVSGVDAATGYTQVVFRDTAFTTQKTNTWCTAAVVQNIRNIRTGESRRGRSLQEELYRFGRDNNRYNYKSAGVDPQGVELTLEAYLPGTEWKQVRASSMQDALREAAIGMRATGLPAVLFVGGGRHVWTMNGYTATGDPEAGGSFTVTHIQFSGPLFPKQKARYGWYDLAPNTRKGSDKFSQVFFPYKQRLAFDERGYTIWNNWFVAVVPVSADEPEPTPTPTEEPEPTEPPDEEDDAAPAAPPEPTAETAPEATEEATVEPPDEPTTAPQTEGPPEPEP